MSMIVKLLRVTTSESDAYKEDASLLALLPGFLLLIISTHGVFLMFP